MLKGHSNLFLIRFDGGGHFPAITLLFNGVYVKLRLDRGLLTLQTRKGGKHSNYLLIMACMGRADFSLRRKLLSVRLDW